MFVYPNFTVVKFDAALAGDVGTRAVGAVRTPQIAEVLYRIWEPDRHVMHCVALGKPHM